MERIIGVENCDHLETELCNVSDVYTGDTCCKHCGKVLSNGQAIVPEGGKYTAADGTVYNPGDEMPETVTTGDRCTYKNYEYRYNETWYNRWSTNESICGWSVRCVVNVADPGQILEEINGQPITDMTCTFRYCTALTTVPDIPQNVTELYETFSYCTSLTSAPVIPDYITSLRLTFASCTNLVIYDNAPAGTENGDFSKYKIPDGVTNMVGTFWECNKLTSSPTIPNSVTDMSSTFRNCTSLTSDGMPILPDGVNSLQGTFYGCSAISNLDNYIIPSSVTDLGCTFENCTGLTNISGLDIKCDIYRLEGTFRGCTSLSTLSGFKLPNYGKQLYLDYTFKNCTSLQNFSGFKLTSNVKEMSQTFYGCTSLTETPDFSSCTRLDSLYQTFYGCTSLKKANTFSPSTWSITLNETFYGCTALNDVSEFVISKYVESLKGTFYGCSSLTGIITINSILDDYGENENYYKNCFAEVDFEAQNITLTGTSAYLDTLGATGTNYCTECNGKCNGTH